MSTPANFLPGYVRRVYGERSSIFLAWERRIWTPIMNCRAVEKSWKKLWEQDMAPYRALRRDAPMVLVGHAAYPAVTRDHTPASLSKKWITDVLRKKIGYRGLVVSDDLEMGGVLKSRIDRAGCGRSHSRGRRFVPDLSP